MSKREYFPTEKNILCKPLAKKSETSGGLAIPDMYQVESPLWEVLAIGPEVKVVKVGDVVALAAGRPGTTVSLSDEKDDVGVLAHQALVLAKVEEKVIALVN